jgi:hypothetical protein
MPAMNYFLIEYEKRDEISKRNVKHVNKNIKYTTNIKQSECMTNILNTDAQSK